MKEHAKALLWFTSENEPLVAHSVGDEKPTLTKEEDKIVDALDNTRRVLTENTRAETAMLMGEVLTAIEIALPPGRQCDALKETIKASFKRRSYNQQSDCQETIQILCTQFFKLPFYYTAELSTLETEE